MNPRVTSLINLLDREAELGRELIQELQSDQQALVQQDVHALEESSKRKESLAVRLQATELERISLCRTLGTELGLGHEPRVSELCNAIGPQAQPLSEAADRLRAVMGSLAELVAISRGFLEQSILGVRSVLSLLQSFKTPQEHTTYDAQGQLGARGEAPAVAVRREA